MFINFQAWTNVFKAKLKVPALHVNVLTYGSFSNMLDINRIIYCKAQHIYTL